MRHDPLRPALDVAWRSREGRPRDWSGDAPAGAAAGHDDDPLGPAVPARERRRPLFRPARGWFRRLERALSHRLSRHLYPRVPGLHLPYSRQLQRGLRVSRGAVHLCGLPAALDGLRVLLITDVHAGPFLRPQALARVFDRLCALDPDLVLLGGDLATSRLDEFAEHAAAFRLLRAPLGVFAVLGNHDHATGAPARLATMVEDCGIRVLHNSAVDLERAGRRLSLAGVDDLLLGRPDLEGALDGTRSPVVLLSHNPDVFFSAARRGVALVLAGHTHAGQIRLPGLPVLVRQSRYRLDEGRYRLGASQLVVSRGLGAVGLPWRVACPPEAVLLTLRRDAGSA